jgi:hypothetical protein
MTQVENGRARSNAATGVEKDAGTEFAEGIRAGQVSVTHTVPSDFAFTEFLVEEARLLGITTMEVRQRIREAGVEPYVVESLRTGRLSVPEACTVLNRHFNDVAAFHAVLTAGGDNVLPGIPAEELLKIYSGEDGMISELVRSDPLVVTEIISYASTLDGTAPLYAEVAYPRAGTDLPVIVVQHGDVVGSRYHCLLEMLRLAKKGLFVLTVSKRGRDGSAGDPDAWGLDVYDIYDAIQHVRAQYTSVIDGRFIGIKGGSGGGIDSLLACVRFPDLFCCAGPYVGPVDFTDFVLGMDWEQMLSCVPEPVVRSAQALIGRFPQFIGGQPDEVPDKYTARNGTLAYLNNPYTQIHLFTDLEEGGHPPNTRSYRAFTEGAQRAGYTNVHLHLSNRGDSYRYIHGGDSAIQEAWYLPGLRSKTYPQPVLVDGGEMVVLGYVRTERFFVRLGSGEDTAARLLYSLSPLGGGTFRFRRLTLAQHPRARLEVVNREGRDVDVWQNGEPIGFGSGERVAVEFDVDAGPIELRPRWN